MSSPSTINMTDSSIAASEGPPKLSMKWQQKCRQKWQHEWGHKWRVEVVVFGVIVIDETYTKVRIRQNHISSIENLTLKYEPVSRDVGRVKEALLERWTL